MASHELARAWGKPVASGLIRCSPEDFVVEERLGFEADGRGEHLMLWVEKVGANTVWVARELARHCGVDMRAVSWAGLKDRHALTRQYFSVHLPGKAEPDLSSWPHAQTVRILEARRHSRKLQRGALRGNRFRIQVRELQGDAQALRTRFDQLQAAGVPNYFGEQRFGHDEGNLEQARKMFAGSLGRVDREQRGFYLSAARSFLFNHVLDERVAGGTWNLGLDGEVWNLDGRGSIFGPEPGTPELDQRCERMEIHPTGPLWGAGELRSSGAVRELEQRLDTRFPEFTHGLAGAGLNQERRPLRLPLLGASLDLSLRDVAILEFELPAGCFATTILREILEYSEPSRNAW